MKIFLIGFMGCGKTHWGKELSHKLQLPFFDLDQVIAEQEDKTINEVFNEDGEEYFRLLEKDALHLITESHESFVMACGGGTPCFYNNIDYMKGKGTTVWINCSIECLYSRLVKEKSTRPLIREMPDDTLHGYIVKKFGDRSIFYQQASVILNESEVSIETLVDRIFHN
jgi:shikimate kinase